jgi:hypothetical protein
LFDGKEDYICNMAVADAGNDDCMTDAAAIADAELGFIPV